MSVDLNSLAKFLWFEADLLDQKDYAAWLDLWDPAGFYVVPIDRQANDYANHLNYAYDDAAMRRMRVARLTSGESISANAAAVTVRTVSRFRRLEDGDDGAIRVRCAQHLGEYRNGRSRTHLADVTYTLREDAGSFRILEKVVLLAHSADTLTGITFLP